MYRVALIGPESCGKTTLGRYLAKRYPCATLLPEIERDYVEALDRPVTYQDIETIARLQVEQIEQTQGEVIIFDAELIVLKVWFDVVYGQHPLWLDEAIVRHPMDCYLLFYPDIAWVADPTRTRGEQKERIALFERYEQEIQRLNIPYYIIRHC